MRISRRAAALKRLGASSLVAILAAASTTVHAQASPPAVAPQAGDEQAAPGGGLEDIVVTARKKSENLQDVPVSVSAFSGEDLLKQNATKISDISRVTPGLMLRQSSTNPSGVLVSMRGQFQRDTAASQDPSVGIYVDGVYWARSYGVNADLVDIQSVQVLKGPQGTLFGRNTTGGAILLQTNDPKYDHLSGELSVLYGRFNERMLTGIVNIPIVTDRVALRGALQINKRDGYIKDYVTGRRYDDRDNITGRVKLGIKASDNLDIILSAERYRFEQAGQARATFLVLPASDPRGGMAVYAAEHGLAGGLTAAQYVDYTTQNRSIVGQNSNLQPPAPFANAPDSKYTTQTYTATATLQTGLGTFKLNGAYRQVEGHSLLDLDGSPWAVYTSRSGQDLEQYSSELQLVGKIGGVLDYAGGAFYFTEDGTDEQPTNAFTNGQTSASSLVRATAASLSYADAYVKNTSVGAYAQVTWHATDALNLTGGIRYSADKRGIQLRTRNLNPLTSQFVSCTFASIGAVRTGDTCTPVGRSDDFSNVSYLLSADYKITPDVMVYARFSKGYRSGGQNPRALSPAQLVPFDPEIVYDGEIGLKSELFDRRVRLNLAAYRSTVLGAQRSTRVQPPGGGANITILNNAAKVRVLGIEGDGTFVLTEGLRLGVSGAITSPKYLSYSDATGDRRGERFNGVAKYQASVMIDYERPIGKADLSLHADYGWSSDTPLDETNSPGTAFNSQLVAVTTQKAGGVANVRATLSFDDDRYEVALFGRNLFDNRARVSALQLIGFGFIAGQYREPVTYGIQLTARFGN